MRASAKKKIQRLLAVARDGHLVGQLFLAQRM